MQMVEHLLSKTTEQITRADGTLNEIGKQLDDKNKQGIVPRYPQPSQRDHIPRRYLREGARCEACRVRELAYIHPKPACKLGSLAKLR